jgi:hypothetical protein
MDPGPQIPLIQLPGTGEVDRTLMLGSWARNGSLQRVGAAGIGPSRGLLD